MRLALAVSLIVYSFVVASADEEEDWDDTYPDDDDDEYENGGNNKYANPSGEAPEPASSYNPEDPNANHRQEGINRDQAGDWQGAITAFQAACRHFPDDAGGFNDLGVANMRVALKGVGVEEHLIASRAAYEMSGKIAGSIDENLKRNLDALKDVEEWACSSQNICYGTQAGKGSSEGGSAGGGAADLSGVQEAAMKEAMGMDGGAGAEQLRVFIKAEIGRTLSGLQSKMDTHQSDFEILDNSMTGQLKALKGRVRKLEEELEAMKKVGGVPDPGTLSAGNDAVDDEPMDPAEEKDEM